MFAVVFDGMGAVIVWVGRWPVVAECRRRHCRRR